MSDPTPSLFRQWTATMGYHAKQISKAARSIGIVSRTKASELWGGKKEPTLTERLAMSARRAGLEPWTPENDGVARAASAITEAFRDHTASAHREGETADRATDDETRRR